MPAIDFALALPYGRLRHDRALRPMLRAAAHNPQSPEKRFSLVALVDSGADVPMLNTRIAAAIGLDLSAGRRSHVVGVGGRVEMVEHEVERELLGRRFAALVHFSDSIPLMMPLLGRRAAFEQFRFGFDERARLLLIDPYP